MRLSSLSVILRAIVAFVIGYTLSVHAQTRILRIVTYNIAADVTSTTPLPGLIAPPSDTNNVQAGGVLEGIGEEVVGSDGAQAIDVLALQETTSNSQTVAPIVNGLNSFYNAPGMYTNSTYQATESSGFAGSGNGPNAIVYNTKTLQLLASVPVDPPGGTGSLGSASGEYREVMRYLFAPAGVAVGATNQFYVYVSHYKSGTGTLNETYRQEEAQIIRSNVVVLSPTARILYVGDFNTGLAYEGMYVTLITNGFNQALDPVNPSGNTNLTWDGNSALDVKTFSPTAIHYRDDYQMMTTNVYYGVSGGLKYVPGTYHVFGNNGSIAYLSGVTVSSNTAFAGKIVTNGPTFISASQLYLDLTNASDHLPVVVDYTIPMPAPRITSFSILGTNLSFTVANSITGGVFTVLMSTNVTQALANWTAVATNIVANTGNLIFTATNVISATAPQRYFILNER